MDPQLLALVSCCASREVKEKILRTSRKWLISHLDSKMELVQTMEAQNLGGPGGWHPLPCVSSCVNVTKQRI